MSATRTPGATSRYERFLLDTNCISELVPPKPDPNVMTWMNAANEAVLYLSVLTLGEIRKGVAILPHSARRTKFETWLEIELRRRFEGRILSIDAAVSVRWGQLTAEVKRRGRTMPMIDGLLAATALRHNLTVVSRNAADSAEARVPVLNPWQR